MVEGGARFELPESRELSRSPSFDLALLQPTREVSDVSYTNSGTQPQPRNLKRLNVSPMSRTATL